MRGMVVGFYFLFFSVGGDGERLFSCGVVVLGGEGMQAAALKNYT